jgi:Flp pilus assembly protein TadD
VTAYDRIRLQQIEREAEGYLELGMALDALDALARRGAEVPLSAHGHHLEGEALRALERYEDALAPLEKAARLAPGDVRIWLALGWCHKRTARLDSAIEDMQQALALEPEEALLHYNLACYFSLAGRKRSALTHLSKAIALDATYRELTESEPDFDPIRSDPQFQALTGSSA